MNEDISFKNIIFEDIRFEDIKKLINDNPKEDMTLEFKEEIKNKNNKKDKNYLLKNIASFANTEGGLIIIGIKENKNENDFDIVGLDLEKNKNPEDTISQMINDNIIPRPDIETKIIETDQNNKFIFLIKVKKYTGMTHYFCKDDNNKFTIMYFRYNAISLPLNYSIYKEYFEDASPERFLSTADKRNLLDSKKNELKELRKEYESLLSYFRDSNSKLGKIKFLADRLAISPLQDNILDEEINYKKNHKNNLLKQIRFLEKEIEKLQKDITKEREEKL